MNCSRARKWIPLYVGSDLSARKTRPLEKHLERCPDCSAELKELKTALASVQAIANQGILDWPEAEWKGLMARVQSEKSGPRPVSSLGAIPKKAWAYGLAIILIAGIAILMLRSILSRPAVPLRSEIIASTPVQPSRSQKTDQAPSFRYPRDIPFQVQKERRATPDRAMLAAGSTPEKTTQNMMSMLLVSQETGLKVHWTFNRNFEWEEKKR